MKILLLEDEAMLRNTLEEYLNSLGHKIKSFLNGQEALQSALNEHYDLMILDISVPEINGLEILSCLKSKKLETPTIFISALIGIESISKAFDLGAADYLKKPFHLRELSLRIDKIKKQLDSRNSCHLILSERYSYSKEDKQLLYNHIPVNLTKKQIQIITLLCENINMVVDFDKFRSYVWGGEQVDNSTIRAEISRVRKLLYEDFIVNIKGVGYKIQKYFILKE